MRVINQRRDKAICIDRYDISIDGCAIYAIGDKQYLLGMYETEEEAKKEFMALISRTDRLYQMPT